MDQFDFVMSVLQPRPHQCLPNLWPNHFRCFPKLPWMSKNRLSGFEKNLRLFTSWPKTHGVLEIPRTSVTSGASGCITAITPCSLNCFSIHQKLNFFSLAQNNSVSNFLIKQTYLSAMISSQSVPLLAILASSLTLTCLSLIKSTLYRNLVIFISETSVEFVIFFLFLQPLLLQIHLFPANLTIAIHFTLASHKQISTNFNAFKIHWHVSLQILQNINTSHQHSKNYTGFLSNKESTTKPVF